MSSLAADQRLAAAIAAHQAGRRAEAETLYREVVAVRPKDAQALYLLGALYYEMKSFDAARDHLERAFSLRPGHAPTQAMLGVVYSLSGDPAKAVPHLKAVSQREGTADAAVNYARALRDAGRPDEALAAARDCARRFPDDVGGQVLLARALLDQKDEIGAGQAFDAALARNPGHGEALLYRGSLHFRHAELHDAERLLRRLTDASPADAVAKNLLGSVLQAQGRLDEAEVSIRAALAIAPDNPDVLMNLGLVMGDRGRTGEAMALHRRAIALKPGLAEAWNNLGFAQQHAGAFDEALASYDHALAVKPDFHGAKTNKAFTLLTLGRLAEGWEMYGHRFDQRIQASKRRQFAYPIWDGRRNTSATLLLWTDQGLGDEVLYMSMLAEARARVGRCIVECTGKMASLFQRSFPDVVVLPRMKPPHPKIAELNPDFQLPLIELGQFLRPSLDAIAPHAGYLKSDPAVRAHLRGKYEALAQGRRIVGISWKSESPRTGAFKTMPLEEWTPIVKTPGVLFVSLQYGAVDEDLSGIVRDTDIDAFNDPDGSAAQVAAMDLVITVSNTTAHFAGGLGVPVWTLVPKGPGLLWYWFAAGDGCPWYPSMRILRQTQPGAWSGVADRASEDLRAWATS